MKERKRKDMRRKERGGIHKGGTNRNLTLNGQILIKDLLEDALLSLHQPSKELFDRGFLYVRRKMGRAEKIERLAHSLTGHGGGSKKGKGEGTNFTVTTSRNGKRGGDMY